MSTDSANNALRYCQMHLQDAQDHLERAIMATPSSETRSKLTKANIILLKIIEVIKKTKGN